MNHLPFSLLLAVAFLAAPCNGHSQNFYIAARAGLAIPAFSSDLPVNGYPYTTYAVPAREDIPVKRIGNASHGAGALTSLTVGYWFRKNLGVCIGLDAVLKPQRYTVQTGFGANGEQLVTEQTARKPVFLTAALTLRDEQILKYVVLKAGIVLPLTNKIVTENRSPEGVSYPVRSRSVMQTRFGIGLLGSVNGEFPVTKRLMATAGVTLTALSLWAKESHNEQMIINGTDLTEELSESQKHVVYEKNYNPDAIYGPDQSVYPSYQIPFGSLAFSAGLMIRL